MRKPLAVAVAGGLVLATLTGPAAPSSAAAKPLKLFLRWDGDGSGGCGPTYLSVEDAPDEGNGCAFIFQAAQEAFVAAGQDALTHEWPGALKKPVTVVAGKAKGSFVVRAYAAVGTTLEVEMLATTSKGSVTIGNFTSEPFNLGFGQSAPVEFSLKIPSKLVNKKVESVALSTTFSGVSQQSYIELDSPAAFITLPVK